MLAIRSVTKRFDDGTLAVEEVSAEIKSGEFVALLGPSGCGKSTLLRLLAGLTAPSDGEIVWDAGARPGLGDIGFVFQDATLMPWADAAENVYLPLRLMGQRRAEAKARIDAALAQVGLAEFAESRPKAL